MIGILDPEGKNNNPLTNEPYSDKYKSLAKKWQSYPVYKENKQILKDIENNNVILVISGTGSGKTVLFPKYMLHVLKYQGKIAITLPKQDITKSAAEFAALTLDVELGKSVGYQFKGSRSFSEETKLLYCTDGTLVSRLLSDPELKDFDAVIIDEAHERKVNIDFLLYLLKNVLIKRKDFKLIIMSATINDEIFKNYYKEFKFKSLSIGVLPNYHIESIFVEASINDYLKKGFDIIKQLLKKDENRDDGILFFVPSISETHKICDELANDDATFKDKNMCISVYAGINSNDVKLATDKDYYRGFIKNGRKIIVATNVAESSLTIEGIKYVIDSGLENKTSYDFDKRINIMDKTLITRAQAIQRMGRTGRTGAGICYHLYSKDALERTMEKFPKPSIIEEPIGYELLRLLNIESIGTVSKLHKVVENFIEPPKKNNVESELEYLKELGLIKNDVLTKMGKIVCDLQIEPKSALSMILGYKLNCFREVVAILTVIDNIKGKIEKLFYLPKKDANWAKNKWNEIKEHFSSNNSSDHLALLKVFGEYEIAKKEEKLNEWIKKYYVNKKVIDKCYEDYKKMKHKYRHKIEELVLPEISFPEDILKFDIEHRIIACFIYGTQNILKQDNKNKLNNKYNNDVKIDRDSFINIGKIVVRNSSFIYDTLLKFGKSPVKAMIVSLITQKTSYIINML